MSTHKAGSRKAAIAVTAAGSSSSKGKQAAAKRATSAEHDEEDSDSERARLPSLQTGFVGGRGLRLGTGKGKRDRKQEAAESSRSSSSSSSSSSSDDDGESDDESRVWSDADADQDSIDEDAADRRTDSQRKNRMGQRARRALFERKYGKEANHLRLQRGEEAKTADAMKGHKRKSQAGSRSGDNHYNGGPRPRPAFDAKRRRIAPAPAPMRPSSGPPNSARFTQPNRTAEPAAPHPSWLAKQKQRERQEAALRTTSQPSRKIVFD